MGSVQDTRSVIQPAFEPVAVAQPPRIGVATASVTNAKQQAPTCCLCSKITAMEDGFVKMKGHCKCICCIRCFLTSLAFSFDCPKKHGPDHKPMFEFDLEQSEKVLARDLFIAHQFEGELSSTEAQEGLVETFTRIKACFQAEPDRDIAQVMDSQIRDETYAAVKSKRQEVLHRLGIEQLRKLDLPLVQWVAMKYSIGDLCDLGFTRDDFVRWDRSAEVKDRISYDELKELREHGIEIE